jgi:hypothetical protein
MVSALALFLLDISSPRLASQSSDFNNGKDTGWTHYSLPNIGSFTGAATFSFPPDDSGGQAYRISAPPTKDDPYGMRNARAGSYRADVSYTGRFSVGTDLLAWNATWRQEAGLFFYLQDINLGQSDGYTATYSSAYQQLYISLINNEVATTVAELGTGAILLDPTHRYRLVASSHDGYTFLFQLFDKAEPNSPWASAIGQDYSYGSGVCGLFVYEQDYPSQTEGAEATFDNYVATPPAAGTLLATVTDLAPPPAGKATAIYPTVTVGILDRDTLVDPGSILLGLDGVWIPNNALTIETQVHKPNNPSSYPKDFTGATVTYALSTRLPWGSQHTNQVAFRDHLGSWQTNTWTWTTAYPYLFASNSLPPGSLKVRGWEARMAQSDNNGVTLDNSLARARQQLAIPPQIQVDRTATSMVQVLNWNKTGTPTNVPGLCPGAYINIAVETCAYLELTAGVHRFRIETDDRAGVYSGATLGDTNAQVLWENPGSTANSTFDFVVEADGLYPVRCLWEETGGDAHLNLRSVNLDDLAEVLINDPDNPVGVVKAWYPIVCRSSSSVTGPYSVDAAGLDSLNFVDLVGSDCSPTVVGQMVTGGTFTVPISGTSHFYYLEGPRKIRITSFTKDASNAVITYQAQ